MFGLLEDLPAAPGPGMLGNRLVAIDEPDRAIIDDERDDTRRVVARYRVAIGVEVDERLRVDLDRLDACGLGEPLGECQEPCALDGEDLADGALRDRRVWPDVRDLGDELREQTIALVDAGDRAAREEAIAQVANRALDLAFVSRFSNGAELGLDAHRGAQGQERGMKPRHCADALEDDGLGIVEQPLAGHAAEWAGGAHERPAQRVDGQGGDELAPHRARVREHHHEQPQRADAAGYSDLANVGPVDLGDLARQRFGHEIGLARRPGPDSRDMLAHGAHRATKPARADHVVQPSGEQLRIPPKLLIDERPIRVDDARAQRRRWTWLVEPEYASDLVHVGLELRRDRPDRPMLGVVQAHDVCLELRRALHRTPPSTSCRRSSKLPSPAMRWRRSRTRSRSSTV